MTQKIPGFPKIFAVGNKVVSDILNKQIEITEKIDGSQFSFGLVDKELHMRSKGAEIHIGNVQKMFQPAVDWVLSIEHLLVDNVVFHGEVVSKKKHNVLTYDKIPKNAVMLYGVRDLITDTLSQYKDIAGCAEELGCDVVPLLFEGILEDKADLMNYITGTSVLGGVDKEGIVIKNYEPILIANQLLPITCAKFVNEAFKEVHTNKMYGNSAKKNAVELLKEAFCTEARWQKGVIHLEERGELDEAPRDIGFLMKEIHKDIEEEEKENIKEELWNIYRKDIMRVAVRGCAEWYKEQLLKKALEP